MLRYINEILHGGPWVWLTFPGGPYSRVWIYFVCPFSWVVPKLSCYEHASPHFGGLMFFLERIWFYPGAYNTENVQPRGTSQRRRSHVFHFKWPPASRKQVWQSTGWQPHPALLWPDFVILASLRGCGVGSPCGLHFSGTFSYVYGDEYIFGKVAFGKVAVSTSCPLFFFIQLFVFFVLIWKPFLSTPNRSPLTDKYAPGFFHLGPTFSMLSLFFE